MAQDSAVVEQGKRKKLGGLVEPRGNGRWGYNIMVNGNRLTDTCGTRADALKAMAVARAAAVNERLGRDYGIGKLKTVSCQTFFDTQYSQWMHTNRSKVTARNDGFLLARFLKVYGGHALNAITKAEFEDYKAGRKGAGRTDATVAYELRRLASFFEQAVEYKHLRENPMDRVDVPTPEKRDYRLLKPEEEQCFWDALPTDTARSLFRFTLYAGLRRQEALGLRVKDVNLDKAVLQISQKKVKGAIKTLELIPLAVDILKAIIPAGAAPDALVFSTRDGKQIAGHTWAEWFAVARKHCKLDGLRPHDLRHSVGTRLAEAGYSIALIAQVLGHAQGSRATLGYIHAGKAGEGRNALASVFA